MVKNSKIRENNFEPAVGGSAGASSYGTSYGTPSGGDVSQDPGSFSSSEKGVSHFANGPTGSVVPNLPTPPDRINTDRSHTSPLDNAEEKESQRPLNPDHMFDKDVDQIFQKKNTPSPDEIMSALQYELSNMVKKDKAIAKRTVIQNLKKDPQFYSRLKMLNISDKDMLVKESQKRLRLNAIKQTMEEFRSFNKYQI